MKKSLRNQPFYKTYEACGTLSKGTQVVEKLYLKISYSLIHGGRIIGEIIGNKDTYDQITDLNKVPGNKLEFVGKEYRFPDLYSFKGQANIRTIIPLPRTPQNSTGIIAEISFSSLKIKVGKSNKRNKTRDIIFYLAGPRTLWCAPTSRSLSSTGEASCDISNSIIELDNEIPFSVEIELKYQHDRSPEGYELATDIYALHLKPKDILNKLSKKKLIDLGEKLVDDLTLLVSFLSRKRVLWFKYMFRGKAIEEYIKQTPSCSSVAADTSDICLRFRDIRIFLRKGLTKLQQLREENFDLQLPLIYHIAATETTHLEEEFAILFLALEKIKDMFAIREELTENLSGNELSTIEKEVRKLIKTNITHKETRKKVYEKIGELNRPSLSYVLTVLFNKHKVKWHDLYPHQTDGAFPFIKTRNKLFHSSSKVDDDKLIKETYRLRYILDRLLLSFLGWENLMHSPPSYNTRWLSK